MAGKAQRTCISGRSGRAGGTGQTGRGDRIGHNRELGENSLGIFN